MPTVYKVEVTKVDGELKFSPIYNGEIADGLYNEFRWDKINILHIFESYKTIIMSNKQEWLSIQHIGAENLLFLWKNWEDIFSEENKAKFKEKNNGE